MLRVVISSVFAAGSVAALFGEDGLLDMLRLRGELRSAESELERQRQRVEALTRTIGELEGDALARERIAREQLGYLKPGEVVFVLPDDEAAEGEAPATPAPRNR